MALTTNEYIILRQLERSPGMTGYEVFKSLDSTVASVPIQSVYRSLRRLYGYCAIDVLETRTHVNGMPMAVYALSDIGQQSIAEFRDWLNDAAS